MKTNNFFWIVAAANLFAGVLLAWGLTQQADAIKFTCVGVGAAVSLLSTLFCNSKVSAAFDVAKEQASQPGDTYQKTGLSDLDLIGRKAFALHVEKSRLDRLVDADKKSESLPQQPVHKPDDAATEELLAIRTFLDTIDHVKDTGGKQTPCVIRLQKILQHYGEDVKSNLGQVVACGREVHKATEELVNVAENQADSVEQTTSIVEQLLAQLLTACDGADQTRQATEKAQLAAGQGVEQFESLLDEVKQMKSKATSRERKLQSLGQHTREIETIVQTIGSLSSRTDLLALNASIESVRAGEHGRGFAVVAEEVRALSEQSAKAVSDISRRLEMIQMETHQSMSAASGEHDQIEDVISRFQDTLESIRSILETSTESSEGLGELATSTKTQLLLAQEIVDSLQQSTENSRNSRSRAEGAHWTAKSFSQLSDDLDQAMQLFQKAESAPVDSVGNLAVSAN